MALICLSRKRFQSTLPVGGATGTRFTIQTGTNISIHAPRGGSDYRDATPDEIAEFISIHAPRGGSDNHQKKQGQNSRISIHAPRGGSDGVNFLRRSR